MRCCKKKEEDHRDRNSQQQAPQRGRRDNNGRHASSSPSRREARHGAYPVRDCYDLPMDVCPVIPSPTRSDTTFGEDPGRRRSDHALAGKTSAHYPRHASDQHRFPESPFQKCRPDPPPRPPRRTVEISPGVDVRLRGADETWKAIENDFYMPAECMACCANLFCILDADYVLCPDCRVVSRMEGGSVQGNGGVGLGFKYSNLSKWQEEILETRRTEERNRQRQQSSHYRSEPRIYTTHLHQDSY